MPRYLAILLVALFCAPESDAQFLTPATRFLQAGVSVGPGLGLQAGAALPAATIFTREAALYADYRFGDREEQRLLVGLGVGGSVRVMRILFIIFDYAPGAFELDAGLRFGPSFAFSFIEETAATRARQFRLFADLFARGAIELQSGRLVFTEIGTHSGTVRVGLLLAL